MTAAAAASTRRARRTASGEAGSACSPSRYAPRCEADAEGAGHAAIGQPAFGLAVRPCWAHATRAVTAARRPAPRHQRRGAEARGHEVRQIVERAAAPAEALVALVAVLPHRVGGVDGAVRPRGRQPATRRRRRSAPRCCPPGSRRGLDGRGRPRPRRARASAAHRSRPTSIRRIRVPPAARFHAVRGLVEPTQANAGFSGERLQHATPIQPSPPCREARAAQALPTTSVTAAAPSPVLRPGSPQSAQPSARPTQATGAARAGSPSERSRRPPESDAGHGTHRRGIPSRTARRARARRTIRHGSGAEIRHPRAATGPCDHHRVGHRAGRLRPRP